METYIYSKVLQLSFGTPECDTFYMQEAYSQLVSHKC